MIIRNVYDRVVEALNRQAAVALIGPRQVGKTTLALEIARNFDSLYLDLESQSDRQKLKDPEIFLEQFEDKLVILDEIHRVPEIFTSLRGLIDRGRRKGLRTGRFLILGSASIDLLRQSGESLAGRISYIDMNPFDVTELGRDPFLINKLWNRGGYPDSFLAANDLDSFKLRQDFVKTYLQRDIAIFGPKMAAETLDRLWTMLAHSQGGLLNASRLAESLMVSAQSITRYVDLLVDLLMVRRLSPFNANVNKRLIKSPKVYIRDSGLLHCLLGIADFNNLFGNPIVGASFEGFAIENLITSCPDMTFSSFYRSAAGAEIDLILELPNQKKWAIEIKPTSSPKLEKGFYHAIEDVKPDKSFVVYNGSLNYKISGDIEAINLFDLCKMLKQQAPA